MKIALILSGQLRSFRQGYQYHYDSLLKHWDVDVYFHTWSKNWSIDVLSLYKPVSFIVEDPSVFEVTKQYRIAAPRHPAKNTIMMYRSNMMSDCLRRASGVTYDWIVRTRFDFALNRTIDFSKLEQNRMYYCDTRQNHSHTEMHDQFVIANGEHMSSYCDLYNHIDSYHDEGCVVNGENLLEWHLSKKGLLGQGIVSYLDLNPPFMHGAYNCGKHSLIRDDMEMWSQ